jgi:hypothetical protein
MACPGDVRGKGHRRVSSFSVLLNAFASVVGGAERAGDAAADGAPRQLERSPSNTDVAQLDTCLLGANRCCFCNRTAQSVAACCPGQFVGYLARVCESRGFRVSGSWRGCVNDGGCMQGIAPTERSARPTKKGGRCCPACLKRPIWRGRRGIHSAGASIFLVLQSLHFQDTLCPADVFKNWKRKKSLRDLRWAGGATLSLTHPSEHLSVDLSVPPSRSSNAPPLSQTTNVRACRRLILPPTCVREVEQPSWSSRAKSGVQSLLRSTGAKKRRANRGGAGAAGGHELSVGERWWGHAETPWQNYRIERVPPGLQPLLVVVNTKSGPQVGPDVLCVCMWGGGPPERAAKLPILVLADADVMRRVLRCLLLRYLLWSPLVFCQAFAIRAAQSSLWHTFVVLPNPLLEPRERCTDARKKMWFSPSVFRAFGQLPAQRCRPGPESTSGLACIIGTCRDTVASCSASGIGP